MKIFSRKIVPLIWAITTTLLLSPANAEQFSEKPNALEVISVGDREYTLIILPKEYFAKRISHYNQTIDKSSPRDDIKVASYITACTNIIDLPAGTARGNHSYGGYCTLRAKDEMAVKVKICDDTLTGKWFMSEYIPPASGIIAKEQILELAQFTIKHCYGG